MPRNNSYTHWSKAMDKNLKRMREAGMSFEAIGFTFGRSAWACEQRLRKVLRDEVNQTLNEYERRLRL